jgi:hypothetical protein
MAYLPLSEFERQKQLQEQTGQPVLAGQGSVLNSSTPTKGTGPSKSGQFVNLQSYLNTNKDQAAEISNKIADTIKTTAQDTRTSLQDVDNQFKNQIQTNTISNLDSAKDEASNIVNQAKTIQAVQPIKDTDLNRFKEIGTAQYKGPMGLEETELYQPLQSKVQKVQNYDSLSKTDEGRFELLNQMFATQRPAYNRGQKLLDNLLLSGSDIGKQKLDEARQSLVGINTDFDNLQNQSRQLAQTTKGKIDDVRNFATQYLTDSQSSRNQEVDSRLQNVEANWANEYNDYVNLLNNYQGGAFEVSKEQADKLGINEGQRLYNLLQNTQGESLLTLNPFESSRAISKDEQAQLTALDQLARQISLGEMSKYKNAALAGTLTDSFNADRFKEEAINAQKTFEDYSKEARTSTAASGGQLLRVPRGFYAGDVFGRVQGTSTGNQSIDEYLRSIAPNLSFSQQNDAISTGIEGIGEYSYLYGTTGEQLKSQLDSQVTQSLASSILNLLNEAGYNNQIKIK